MEAEKLIKPMLIIAAIIGMVMLWKKMHQITDQAPAPVPGTAGSGMHRISMAPSNPIPMAVSMPAMVFEDRSYQVLPFLFYR